MTDKEKAIQELTIKLALLFNGGDWDKDYNDFQKEFWRNQVLRIMTAHEKEK